MELEVYTVDRRVINIFIQQRLVSRRRYDPQARPSTSFVDNTIDRLGIAKISKCGVWDQVPEGSALNFGHTRICLKHLQFLHQFR